ncbi:hypothetical protein PTKIN_Ptkin04bG0129600 [Pterospermum kingtungense]
MKTLVAQNEDPWLCFGDFNEILWNYEKSGDHPRPEWQMENFRNAIDECGLSNLGFIGKWHIWERGLDMDNNVRVRLDRAMWTKDEECREIVKRCWHDSGSEPLEEKLKITGAYLQQWHLKKYGKTKERIKELERELEDSQNQEVNDQELNVQDK